MTLNKQLFLVSLLLLSIPWSGCQYLQEIDASLRSGQEQTLRASTQVIVKALSQSPEALTLDTHKNASVDDIKVDDSNVDRIHEADAADSVFYCHPMNYQIDTDGYADGWPKIEWSVWSSTAAEHVSYRCAIHKNQLMLFFDVKNSEMVFNNPTRSLASNGDRVVLVTGNEKEYIFAAVAPGKVTGRYFKSPHITYRESSIEASLIDNVDRYQLEISMPLALVKGKLSFYIIDESASSSSRFGPYEYDTAVPELIYQPDRIRAFLSTYAQAGQRLSLLNPDGWLIASIGTAEPTSTSKSHWLLQKFYRGLLAGRYQGQPDYFDGVNFFGRNEFKRARKGQSSSLWYKDPLKDHHHVLANAEPIFLDGQVAAILIAEQSSEQTATLTDQAFGRLFSLSIIVMGGATLTLLAYASWLSWRIRKLSKATQNALDERGIISNYYPHSNANDEIGVLSRNYGELMKRIGDYTVYLQTLSRKLSHELRTPLAIIHSSLDNLESQQLDSQSRIYQQRAKEGALRLGKILTAMSEAKRVEEIIEHSELESVDVIFLVTELIAAYSDLYDGHTINFENNVGRSSLLVNAVPDLLVQMLDKLIENAVSFCPPAGVIVIAIDHRRTTLELTVNNDGPLLPKSMQNQLFDNMVSLREERESSATHLGLGLYIVSLIVNFHSGSIIAKNRDDNRGVIFSINLPIE